MPRPRRRPWLTFADGKQSERHQSQKAYEEGFADGQKKVLEQSAEKVKQEYCRGYNMAIKTAQEAVTQDYDLGFQHGGKLAFGIGSTVIINQKCQEICSH